MVANIVPGVTGGAGALGAEPRIARAQLSLPTRTAPAPQDSVSVSTAQRVDARASIAAGLDALDLAVAAGRAALDRIAALAGGDDVALAEYNRGLDASPLLRGESVDIAAEPDASPFAVAGFDARLTSTNAEALEGLRAQLRQHLARFESLSRELDAHAALLDAAEAARGARTGLDADAARLLALQARQGLEADGGLAIANANQHSVLDFFRA
jgi:hypothetical protein